MAQWARPPLPARWSRSDQPPFVGRRREIAVLEEMWMSAMRGAGGAVLIAGQAGAGKSRLAAEVATALHGRGAAVLVGSCVPELAAPYEPFDGPIRSLATAIQPDDHDATAADRRSGLLDRLTTTSGATEDHGRQTDALVQRQLYDAFVTVLRDVSEVTPLVLVLEDIQFAGETALQLLGYVVEHTVDSRVLLLITERSGTRDRTPAQRESLARLHRLDGVRSVDPAPLTVDDVAEYVSREAADVSESQARGSAVLLVRQSGGNPFLLRELWRDAELRGGVAAILDTPLVTPRSVRDTMGSRVDRLPAKMLEVLTTAAVLGEQFDPTELRTVCEPLASADVAAALDLGVAHGLIGSDEEVRFSFRHAIARQLLLDRSPPSELAGLHARIALRLDHQFPAAAHRVQRLAHHYVNTRSATYSGCAVRYLLESAALAERSLAHEDAAHLLLRAADITADPDERDELRLRSARSCTLASDFARARALNEEVFQTVDPRRRLRAAIGYEVASWRPGLLGYRAVELLTEALSTFRADPSDPVYVRALAALARAAAFTGAVSDASELGNRAVSMARAMGDDQLLAATLRANLTQSLRPREIRARLAQADELSAMAGRTGDIEDLGPGAYFRAAAHYLLGDPKNMDVAGQDLDRVSDESGSDYWRYWAGCLRYGRQFVDARFADARQTCRLLEGLQETFGADKTDGPLGLQTYMLRRETGKLGTVRAHLTGRESPTGHWAPGLLALYTELKMKVPARRLLSWLLERDGQVEHDSADWPARLAFMTDAAVWLDDADAAAILRPLVAEYSGFNLMAGDFVAVFGSADRYVACLDSLLGAGAADAGFRTALAMDESTGAPLHRAETMVRHAQHLRRIGADAAEIRPLVDRARVLSRNHDLHRVSAMIEAVVEWRGRSADGLSAREVEVLRLLARGLSNRDLAGCLFISENTASNHVRSILMKTGMANRTQAAMYAGANGFLDASG